MMTKHILILTMGMALAACSLSPDYARPEFTQTAQWSQIDGYPDKASETAARDMTWSQYFVSPQLQKVIAAALTNNKDLRLAALNVEQARATYRINRADLLPSITVNGAGNYAKTSDRSSVTGDAQKTEIYSANVGLSTYELDLFGKIRSGNEAALNDYFATAEAEKATRNALIAETANAYLQLLADQKLLQLTEKTLEAQRHTHNLLSESLKNGVATEQDVARAATAMETAQVNLHQYRRFVELDKNALYVLMGVPHAENWIPQGNLDTVVIRENLNPGLPSDILLARPDIRQAEYVLKARNADIGAARAAFFPSISLTGSYGYASQGLSHLFTQGAAGAYSFVPQITLPIFEGGRNQANLDVTVLRKDSAIIAYEQAIENAFRDVSDELAARATLDEQLLAQKRLVAAAQKVYDLSDARYKAGIDSFLSVLDAQRELYAYQQGEIQLHRQKIENAVNLYRALGGGVL